MKINNRTSKTFILLVIAATCFLMCTKKNNQSYEIAQWRGDNRNGIYNERGLLSEWPADGPKLLWKIEGIGKGFASPSIMNDKLFINGEQDSMSFLFAYDLKGNLLWKAPNGSEFMGEGFSATYPGARSTPTVYNNLVYTTSGNGRIACFDINTGEEIWTKHIVDDLGGLPSFFGYAESLVVDDQKAYCFPGGNKNNTVAMDRLNGEIVWSSEAYLDTFSYCSPVVAQINNTKLLVTHSRHKMYLINCDDGKALGKYTIKDYQYDGEHCNSPVYHDGSIYFIGNEKKQGAFRLDIEERGKKLNEIWVNSKIKNNFNGYVVTNNKLFSTIKGGWLKALSTENGQVVDSVKVATGSLIFADNKFICYGMNGDLNLVDYSDQKLAVKSTFKIKDGTDHHFAHPVIKNGILYIRHGNALMAYNIAEN